MGEAVRSLLAGWTDATQAARRTRRSARKRGGWMMTHPIGDLFGRERKPDPTRSIQTSIEIAAPPDVVFRALADPHELVAWLGDLPASDTTHGSPSAPQRDPAS